MAPQTSTWKAALMTGDDSLNVFDNARKTLNTSSFRMGNSTRQH